MKDHASDADSAIRMHWSQFFSIIWDKFLYTFLQELKSFYERSFYCVCLKSKTLCSCQFSLSSLFSPWLFRNICEFGAKKYFADHRTANTIQLFVATKGSFSGLFFFWTCRCKGEFLRDYLINAITCVFTCYWNRHLVVDKNLLKVTWKQIALTAIFHFGHVFVFCRLESGSQLPKYLCYLLQWKPDKNDGKCFLSHLKLIFLHQDIFIFLLTFWSCRKNCVIRKI